MSETKKSGIRWKGTVLFGLLLLLALVLVACGAEPTEVAVQPTEAETAPTEVPTEPPAPTDTPTEPPTPTDIPTEPPPTATPTEEPTPEPVVDDTGCITCHSDEETLKALAVEPEAAEALSEGEG